MSTKIPALGLVLTAGAALASFAAPARAYTVYTSFAAWQSALSGYAITTDTFSTTIQSAQSITLDTGIVSTNSAPAVLPNTFDNNSVYVVTPGAYDNAVQAGSGTASNTIDWLFPSPVQAFGADFFNANSGRLSLTGDFDGTGPQTISVYDTIGAANGFLGVIGTTPFNSIAFGNPTTTVDGFSLDNAAFAPVPGPVPLLGASAAFGWSRRLRQRLAGRDRHTAGSARMVKA